MSPNVHQDCKGRPVNPGDFLTDNFVTFQVVCLHGSGQFVHADETGALVTNFCCCFTVCPPPAPQSSCDSLAAPAEAVQGVVTHQRISEIRAAWAADRAASWASFRATWPMHVVELFRVVGFGFLVGLVLAFALVVWLL